MVAQEELRLGDKDAFGASKKPATALTRQLISWIDRIDMNVILICHEKALWGKDSDGKQSQIGTTFDGYEKLEYELNLALNIVKQGSSRKAVVKKTRLTQFAEGSYFDWNYETFANLYGKERIEGVVKQIVLATEEQLEEIKILLDKIKLTDSIAADKKIAAFEGDFTEVESETLSKMITYLKGK
jgi:hypothetical protein